MGVRQGGVLGEWNIDMCHLWDIATLYINYFGGEPVSLSG